MIRLFALAAVLVLSGAGSVSAQCCPAAAAPAAGGPVLRLLTKLNQPIFPSLPAVPGVPTASPLGLAAPRLSFFTTFVNTGGFGNLSANLPNIVGIATPRFAPFVGLAQNWPPTPQVVLNTGLGFAAPRVASGVQIVQGFAQTGQTLGGMTGGIGGGGLFGRRCR